MSDQSRLDPDVDTRALREALVRPTTWREEDRSFEVIWTTGAAVTRMDWWDGEIYDETLSVEPGDIRLDRIQSGGPVLLDHRSSTDALAGSIEPGSVRIQNGKGIARVRLAATPDMESIVAKVRDGHLKCVSVGYIVHRYERTEKRGSRPIMHAADWEPTEISLTPVPADAGAQVRTRSNHMPDIITIRDENDDRDPPRQHSRSRDRRRIVTEARILQACSRAAAPRDFERQLLEDHEEQPLTEEQLTDAIGDLVASRRNLAPIRAGRGDEYDSQTPDFQMRSAFVDVIYSRLSGAALNENAREYAGASFVDMARAMLAANGERVQWASATTVIDKALRSGGAHTTSDFAGLLQDAGVRYLLHAFHGAESPLKQLAKKRNYQDFRKRYGHRLDGDPALLLTLENGEFKRATLAESKAGSQLATYGRIFKITRAALVNDDLGAFESMAAMWARAQAELEASSLAAHISGHGVVMDEDGKTLFHADHGNLAGSGGGITESTLSAARMAMREQRNFGGSSYANVVPKYLVVGSAKETEAQKVLAAISPATTSDVNPFSGKLELVVDARLAGNSWRLFADPEQYPVIEYGHLEGQDGLFMETRSGFDVDGVEFKARVDLGVGLVDYRGAYMNPGN